MKRLGSYLIVALCFGLASCDRVPTCGAKPSKPESVRTAAFFGRVSADAQGWTVGLDEKPAVAKARLVIGGRTITTDAQTERLGYCNLAVKRTRCAAFVGLRHRGVAAWVLLAHPQQRPLMLPTQRGRLEIDGTTVWQVQTDSIVLSQGVKLRFGRPFARKLARHDFGLRLGTVRQVDPTLYVDPRTGTVLDVVFAGCM